MTSALRWALVTGVLTIVVFFLPVNEGRAADQPLWVRGAMLVAGLGVPVAGGVMALAKGTTDRSVGRSPGQTRVAIGLGIALVTLGLGLLLAMTSLRH